MADDPTDPEPDPEPDAPVEERVNRVEAALDGLRTQVDNVLDRITGKHPVGDDPAVDPEPDPEPTPTTARGEEASMAAEVRAELERIRAEEKHAEDHAKLAKEPERAPVSLGRVTRALWGDRE